MSDQANLLLNYAYRESLLLQAQDTQSQLGGAVTRGVSAGEKTRHQLIGKVNPVERVSRHQDTTYTPTPHDDRWSVARDFSTADLYDQFDKVRTVVMDVNAKYATAQVAAMRREEDKLIQSAMAGTAITGQTGTGTQSLPAGQQLAQDDHAYDEAGGSGDVALTYYKVINGIALLKAKYGASVNGRIHGLMSARQEGALIASTKTSSKFYVPDQLAPFATGQISKLLGVTWHLVSDDVYTVDSNSDELVYLWVPEAVALDINMELVTKIDQLPQKMYSWQIFTQWIMGAVRLDDSGVVEIQCDPTPTL